MTSRHQLDLLENAIDSLNEALVKYEQSKAGDVKAYKFCVLHLSHFLELVLKHYVTLSHPLLLYKNPFAKGFDQESQTIGIQEATNFLKNEGRNLPASFLEDLYWLKRLRNHIEHHKFEMDIAQVEASIGRLISAFVKFDQAHENIGLDDYVDIKQYDLFLKLADNYALNLKRAENEVEQAALLHRNNPDFQICQCDQCGHDTFITDEDSETGWRCTFCGSEESDSMEIPCGLCDMPWYKSQMKYLGNL